MIGFIIMLFLFFHLSVFSQTWKVFPQFISTSQVYSSYVFNNKLYIGGGYGLTSNPAIHNIGVWDSVSWQPLNNGIKGAVNSICDYNRRLYLGGGINEYLLNPVIKNIAVWNGSQFSPLSTYPNSGPDAMKKYKNKLYVAGGFGQIAGQWYLAIASWNDTIWGHVGNYDALNSWATSLDVFNNELYVGGNFGWASGIYTPSIARWNGSQWSGVGGGLSGPVFALKTDTINNFLYAGGTFYATVSGVPTENVMYWDGYKWNSMGTGFGTSEVRTLEMYNRRIWAGGGFGGESGHTLTPLHVLAWWDGTKWNNSTPYLKGTALTLKTYKNELYVGGGMSNLTDTFQIARLYMPPDTSCSWLQPRVLTTADTVYINQQNPATVQFSNNNAYSEYWQWNFGDGATDTVRNPVHTFAAAGIYPVQVTVKMENCTVTATKYQYVLHQAGHVLGKLTYANSTKPLGNARVQVKNNSTVINSAITDSAGQYFLSNMPNGSYTLTAFTELPWCGVTATDVLRLKLDLCNYDSIPSRIQLAAADPDSSGTVNATDILLLERRIVGLDNSFQRNDWIFQKPVSGDNDILLSGGNLVQNLVAICTGDVNASYRGCSTVTGNSVKIAATNFTKSNSYGTTDNWIVCVNESVNISALQLFFAVPEGIEITEVKTLVPIAGLLWNKIGNELNITWSSIQPMPLQQNDMLLVIAVKAKQGYTVNLQNDGISLSGFSEIADATGNVTQVSLIVSDNNEMTESGINTDKFFLGNNLPNPFKNSTKIPYYISEGYSGYINIYNTEGILIEKYPVSSNNNCMELKNLLWNVGFYMYSLEVNGIELFHKKMILVK